MTQLPWFYVGLIDALEGSAQSPDPYHYTNGYNWQNLFDRKNVFFYKKMNYSKDHATTTSNDILTKKSNCAQQK
jgi:hypothetical protein